MSQEIALRRRAGEGGIEYVPVFAPQCPVLKEVRHPLQRRALQPGWVRPARSGERDDRLCARDRALQCRLRGLVTDRLTHRTRGQLHEVLFERAHRGLQLEQVRLLLLERVPAGECLADGPIAHGEHDGGDEQRHHELEQRESATARAHGDPYGTGRGGGGVGEGVGTGV